MNFNEIFRKDVTYDDIKSEKTQGLTLILEDTVFEKPQVNSSPLVSPFPHTHQPFKG